MIVKSRCRKPEQQRPDDDDALDFASHWAAERCERRSGLNPELFDSLNKATEGIVCIAIFAGEEDCEFPLQLI